MHQAASLLARLALAIHRQRHWTQVLHLNWLQSVIATIGSKTPVLATVLGTDLALMERPAVRQIVRLALRGKRSIICPNAEWMVPMLQAHLAGLPCEIRYIPFGIDAFWYKVDRAPPAGKKVWLTVLRVTRRKIGTLFDWTRGLDSGQNEFHLFGPLQETLHIPPWIHYHGPVSPHELATQWYPRATGMISLSTHDEGRPQVLLEAMAAGVPLICSDLAAHVSLCGTARSARLVSDQQEFIAALSALSSAEQAGQQASRARAQVSESFGTWVDCARRYHRVHTELAEMKPGCA